jgi:hypothetical protein
MRDANRRAREMTSRMELDRPISTANAVFHMCKPRDPAESDVALQISFGPFTALGVLAISLFLGIHNNASYGRILRGGKSLLFATLFDFC